MSFSFESQAGGGQAGRQMMDGLLTVNDHPYFMEVVLCFGGSTGDPRGLAEPKFTPDHKRVGWDVALAVGVVVLEGPEETRGALVECVGSSEEFWTRPYFTSEQEIKVSSQWVFQHYN